MNDIFIKEFIIKHKNEKDVSFQEMRDSFLHSLETLESTRNRTVLGYIKNDILLLEYYKNLHKIYKRYYEICNALNEIHTYGMPIRAAEKMAKVENGFFS